LFFLFRGISGKNPRDRLQWKGFQVCQIGNFAGFSQGAGFWKIPIPKEIPAKFPMF
jgi:hypothetical protein